MKKGIGYYMKSYLKNNAVVLFFELIVILLLSLVCTMLLGGEPIWLGPTMALVAYLLAELRFMMAYVASNANAAAKEAADATEEDDLFEVQPDESKEALSYDEYTPPAPISDEQTDKDTFASAPKATPAAVAAPETDLSDADLDNELDLPAKSTLDLDE